MIYRIRIGLLRVWSRLRYRPFLQALGARSFIECPGLLLGARNITIGNNSSIRWGARIEAQARFAHRTPVLRIGNNTNVEQNVHIMCHSRVEIGDNCSISGHCAIVDITHPFDAGKGKIGDRILDEESFVVIEDDVFIGFGTVILPNVRIGRGTIVGANSVVTTSLPPMSVASGAPAAVRRTRPS